MAAAFCVTVWPRPANSLKTTRNKTGYRYVYPVGGTYRGTHSFFAKVHDIKAGKYTH